MSLSLRDGLTLPWQSSNERMIFVHSVGWGGGKKETAHKTNDSIFNVIRGKNTKYLAISRDMIIYNDGRRLSDTAQFDKLFFFKLLDLRISLITIKRVLLSLEISQRAQCTLIGTVRAIR